MRGEIINPIDFVSGYRGGQAKFEIVKPRMLYSEVIGPGESRHTTYQVPTYMYEYLGVGRLVQVGSTVCTYL